MSLFSLKSIVLTLLLTYLFSLSMLAQKPTLTLIKPILPQSPVLIDEFGRITGEDRSARFDAFFIELSNRDAVGYVFIYCGKRCSYGEVERHMRGIELKTATHGFDRERLIIMHGGFKETLSVELWVVPPGVLPPRPRGSVHLKNVVFSAKPVTGIEPYDCCEDNGYLWKMLKPQN